MDVQNKEGHNGSTHMRVNFSQSEKISLPRGWGVKILVTTGGGGVGR